MPGVLAVLSPLSLAWKKHGILLVAIKHAVEIVV